MSEIPQPKTKQRVVSQIEYAWLQSKTVGVVASSLALWMAALFCGIVTLLLGIALIGVAIGGLFDYKDGPGNYLGMGGCLLSAIIVLGTATYYMGRWACAGMQYSAVKDAVPLTRANTADLPANDSLVRAAQEPTQAQESVLLRAATGDQQEACAEQLVRAASRQD